MMKFLATFAISAVAARAAPPATTGPSAIRLFETDSVNLKRGRARLELIEPAIARWETRILDYLENKPLFTSRDNINVGYKDVQKWLKAHPLRTDDNFKKMSAIAKVTEEQIQKAQKTLRKLQKMKAIELTQLSEALVIQDESEFRNENEIDTLERVEDSVQDDEQEFKSTMEELECVKEKQEVEELTDDLRWGWANVKMSRRDYYTLLGLTALNPDILSVKSVRKRINNVNAGIDRLSNEYYKELMPEDYERDVALKNRKRNFLKTQSEESRASAGENKRMRQTNNNNDNNKKKTNNMRQTTLTDFENFAGAGNTSTRGL